MSSNPAPSVQDTSVKSTGPSISEVLRIANEPEIFLISLFSYGITASGSVVAPNTVDAVKNETFSLKCLVPHYHDIRHIRASFKAEAKQDTTDRRQNRRNEIARIMRTSVVGWEGKRDEQGNLEEFDLEKAVAFMTSDDMEGWANRFLVSYQARQVRVLEGTDLTTGYPLPEVTARGKP